MAEAERLRRATGRRTIVFIDEIHRFNKAQQDAFLPRVEAGDIVLIGATTENPSFEVNAALLSRSKVFVLRGLTTEEVAAILRRALTDPERGLGASRSTIDDDALRAIALYANGDARSALEPARAERRARRRSSTARGTSTSARVAADDPAPRAALRQVRARSTTTSSRRCTSRCATAIPTRRSTGWRAWSRPARIRSTSRAGWCASRRRTSATPIRRR